jgi:hypothetical protein
VEYFLQLQNSTERRPGAMGPTITLTSSGQHDLEDQEHNKLL